MVKRLSTSSAAAPASKAAKVDGFVVRCSEVTEALRQAHELPSVVRDMLCEMLPFSVKTYHEERHEYQRGIVETVDKELVCMEDGFVRAIGEAEDRLGQMGPEKERLEAAVEELRNKLEARQAATHERKHALAADAVVFRAAKESLAEAKGKLEACEKATAAAKSRPQELERVLREDYAPLKEGTLDQAVVSEAASALGPRLQGFFSLDGSLLTAIPTVLAKEPSSRGTFDFIVIEQLEGEAKKAMDALAGAISEEAQRESQQAAAVHSADEAFKLSREQQRTSAEAFVAVRREEEECEGELQAANKALKAFYPERRKREKAPSQAQASLQDFRDGPLATFRELCGRSAPALASEEAAEGAGEEAGMEGAPAAASEA